MYLLLSHVVSLLHALSELCFSYSLLYRHLVKASCFFSFLNLVNLAALGLSCGTSDLLFCCSMQTSNCGMWAQFLCSMQDLSSLTRDWTHIPCTARQILNRWTTREVPRLSFNINLFNLFPGRHFPISSLCPLNFIWQQWDRKYKMPCLLRVQSHTACIHSGNALKHLLCVRHYQDM